MKKNLILLFSLVLYFTIFTNAFAAESSWSMIAEKINTILDKSYQTYLSGNHQQAKNEVSDAYLKHYEKKGFEKITMMYISGKRVRAVELQFRIIKRYMKKGESKEKVKEALDKLKKMIVKDARYLDGDEDDEEASPENNSLESKLTAENVREGSWAAIAFDIVGIINEAYSTYVKGDHQEAKEMISKAYLQHYEKKGFEKITMMYISGKRVRAVELQFRIVKRYMKKGEANEKVKQALTILKEMVIKDARTLDGDDEKTVAKGNSTKNSEKIAKKDITKNAGKIFIASFIIIVREGAEAMLIVAAILAFLIKVGSLKSRKSVYWGVILAILASFGMAYLLELLNLSGKQNEIFEGITIAVAVVMLFYVGNWFQSKSSGNEWNKYIKNQVSGSLERGSEFSLAFTAFLAVFREGAETILFYKAIPNDNLTAKWSGFLVGLAVLAVIYLLVKYLSLKIPLKPFFMATSILIYLMAILFVGSIAPEFQEAGVMELNILPGLSDESFSAISWLGVYPYYETLIPQLVALLLAIYGSIKHYGKKVNN